MDNNNSLKKLEALLLQNEEWVVESALNKNKVAELARKYDSELLNALQSEPSIKDFFFTETDSGLVFKKDIFLQFLSNKSFLPDSYTAYQQKIGLATGVDEYLVKSKEVVLNWPYKDAVLEGGQDKEDAKRNEVFFSEVLAPDQINRLLDNKVFIEWKRHDKDGVKDLDELKDGDNLILKGNNLVILHSLKKRYAGKVKLIYIDPPYNTGSDSFGYNDRFTHSTWLTFMKNRLETSKSLLSDSGVIFVHCDDVEQSYLKVLMDEIFGRDNFVATLIHQRAKGGGNAKYVVKGHDYVVIFANNLSPEIKFTRDKVIQSQVVEINGKSYIRNDDVVRKKFGKYDKSLGDRRCFYEELDKYKSQSQITEIKQKIESGEYVLEPWDEGRRVIVKYTPVDEAYSKLYSIVLALSEDGSNEVADLGLEFGTPKPEAIIKFLISSVTKAGDLVLDYHLGSGTTAAVAHKLGRRYIGIEQMPSFEDAILPRLNKVIEGEQGGISREVNWQGGGDFVSAVLLNDANKFRDDVENAKTDAELEKLLLQAKTSSFLSYRVDPGKIKSGDKGFTSLSIADKKRLLKSLVDDNTLYVNYSDIDDQSYEITTDEKRHNRTFYGDED